MVITVFVLSLILAISLLYFSSPNVMEPNFWKKPISILILLISISIVLFGSLLLFQIKTIRIGPKRIIFQNYLMPKKVRIVNIKDYDCYKIVHEETENGVYEAVWLMKNGKMADSFSTYQYKNYNSMVNAMILKYEGTLSPSPMKLLMCKLGFKI